MLTQRQLCKDQGGITGYLDAMSVAKWQAHAEEFPWLERVIELSWFDDYKKSPIIQVYTSEVEYSLMNYYPEKVTVSIMGEFLEEIVLLLDEKGEVITVQRERKRKKFFLFGRTVSKNETFSSVVNSNSSVGSIVEQLGEKSDDIRFIVSFYAGTSAVIIYTLPKGVSLRQLFADGIRREIKSEKAKLWGKIDTMV